MQNEDSSNGSKLAQIYAHILKCILLINALTSTYKCISTVICPKLDPFGN